MSLALLFFVAAAQAPVAAPVEVPFRTVAFGKNGLIKEGGAIVIRNAKEFDAYRKKMRSRDDKKPAVQWGKEQIVAIHAQATGFGPMSLQVLKVRMKPDGSLEVEASIDPGSRPPTPTPGVMMVLKKEGLYTLIAVPPARGEVTLKVVGPPSSSGDRSGTSGSR